MHFFMMKRNLSVLESQEIRNGLYKHHAVNYFVKKRFVLCHKIKYKFFATGFVLKKTVIPAGLMIRLNAIWSAARIDINWTEINGKAALNITSRDGSIRTLVLVTESNLLEQMWKQTVSELSKEMITVTNCINTIYCSLIINLINLT